MQKILDLLSQDPQMVLVVVVGLLGLMFLKESASRRSTAAKWLAGSALFYGLLNASVLLVSLFVPVDTQTRAWMQTLIGLPALAGVAAGVVAIYRPDPYSYGVFGVYLITAPCLVILLHGILGPSPYYGPVINAIGLAALAVWCHVMAPQGTHATHRRSVSLTLALLSFPLLVTLGLLNGLDLARIRELLSVPIGIIFVVLMTQILQMDARLVAAELDEKTRAQDALKQLNDTLEQQVERRTEQLVQLNQGLQAFAGMVSHDLSAPVRNITGLAQLALDDHRQGRHDALESMLELIGQESMRANAMVTDLLTLAKTDGMKPQVIDVDMGSLVAQCLRSLALQYPAAEQAVQVDPLPTIRADQGLMRHVVTNLLSNALKFGAGRDDLAIRMSADEPLGHWRFTIRDNGPGFDPERASELFKPFVRLNNTRTAGTGLGLTVVQRAVEIHGGQAGADSSLQGGATFWWTLPRG